jgi:hypothetical protein
VGALYNDRVFIAGQTQSGKSELLNYLFSTIRAQRLLIDTKDEFSVTDVEAVRSVDAIDWQQPVIHYIDAQGGAAEFDELFEACLRRRRLTVFAHELADLCEHSPNRAPRHMKAYATKGAAHGLGLYGGSQRPVNVPTVSLTEAQHVIAFVPKLTRRDDLQAIAAPMGISADELAGELDSLLRDRGRHSFLWWDLREQTLTGWDPLPDAMRAQISVTRRTVA